MSFGGADNPFGGLELTVQGSGTPEQPERPLAEITAEHDASLAAVQAEHGEAMNAEARRQQIGEAVFAMATDGAEGEELLGAYIEHETFPDGMNQCLFEAECRRRESAPEYDITAEDPRRIARMLEMGLHQADRQNDRTDEESAQAEQTEETEETADIEDETADSYQELVAELRAEGKTTVQIINELANHAAVPEAERVKLQGFQRLLAISQRFPDDAPMLAQRINTLDMSQGVPNPTQFIQTVIFSSPDFDSGFSEAFQSAVATEFNLTPRRPEQPRNATEMQTALREGRGTREITEIRRVEEPPGSGNWVEQEVVVGEEILPFEEADPLVLSVSPRVVAFPDPPGSDTYRVESQIADAAPIGFEIQVPSDGALPEAEIHQRMNQHLLDSVFSNAGLNGAMEYLSLRQDATLGGSADTNGRSIGQGDVLQNILQAFSGYSIDVNSRFMTETDLANITPDLRWLTIDGDFGHANQNDPALTAGLMSAVFGDTATDINTNLRRANQFINAGGAETPSYQALYSGMYPEDAANGFPRLREIVGDAGMAALNLGSELPAS